MTLKASTINQSQINLSSPHFDLWLYQMRNSEEFKYDNFEIIQLIFI